MRLDQKITVPKFNVQRVLRALMWAGLVASVIAMVPTVFGITGQFIMVILDTSLGSRWTPRAPYASWAIAGAILGLGPALWTVPYLRKRKMLVLWVPLGLILSVGLVSCLPFVK